MQISNLKVILFVPLPKSKMKKRLKICNSFILVYILRISGKRKTARERERERGGGRAVKKFLDRNKEYINSSKKSTL